MVKIPKILGHIWIGHLPAPEDWMQSWKDFHPDWEYRRYDNDFLFSRRWRNQDLINAFFRRREYAGVADLMRYEILLESGGFIPGADSICLRSTDALWNSDALYTVYESEAHKPGMVSPFLASVPGHGYLEYINKRVKRRNKPATLSPAWRSVGNKFLKRAIEQSPPGEEDGQLVIFPSYYFIPQHKTSERYEGDGPVYCEQLWGSTLGRYDAPAGHLDVEQIHAGHMAVLESKLA